MILIARTSGTAGTGAIALITFDDQGDQRLLGRQAGQFRAFDAHGRQDERHAEMLRRFATVEKSARLHCPESIE
jgi:hypothetical protein